jgi:hypothetical protein
MQVAINSSNPLVNKFQFAGQRLVDAVEVINEATNDLTRDIAAKFIQSVEASPNSIEPVLSAVEIVQLNVASFYTSQLATQLDEILDHLNMLLNKHLGHKSVKLDRAFTTRATSLAIQTDPRRALLTAAAEKGLKEGIEAVEQAVQQLERTQVYENLANEPEETSAAGFQEPFQESFSGCK